MINTQDDLKEPTLNDSCMDMFSTQHTNAEGYVNPKIEVIDTSQR